ncbi:uncharacterized protein LOC107825918 [Nicotiana tabacum]|uniref:Uncharacterized protein LOC107825918 n=1 Tax=Nicotiana tabacum TaxID=4097 RepID=A0A1S4D4M2_TOBAC|nr:PREDICTED: uncharacterized protein LOC107825918 [Nicotiana tabacum]
MEVAIPYNEMDNFEFNSARSSPFTTPPSTPKPFNGEYYYSAPPSPSHLSQFYREFDSLFLADNNVEISSHVSGDDFAFDVSQELEKCSVSAEELFDGGMIKPLKPSPISETQTRNKKQETEHPFVISTQKNTRKSCATERESRAKQRVSSNGSMSSSSSRRETRSLSPMRISQYQWEEEEEKESSNSTCSVLTSSFSNKGSRKWRFKDFFLFRSASEGRASDKDPLKKYTAACKEGKGSSFKGNDCPISSSKAIVTTRGRKKGQVSAHELHYTVNRAVSSDLKKRTFLPYKQGILGQLAFNPAVHALANGFGLSRKS